MNRRELLMGVAATPIAWAWQQYASTHRCWSFSAFVKRPVAGTLASDLVPCHWYHMVWSGDQFFIDGVLAPRDDKKWIDMDLEIFIDDLRNEARPGSFGKATGVGAPVGSPADSV